MDNDTDQVPRYSDPVVMGVYNSYIPALGAHASQLALTDAVIDGPFGYQLVHGNPEIDAYLRRELAKNDPTATYPNYISNPTPGLVFFPSASSSGWLVSGLPIETTKAINHPRSKGKMWIRYGAFGFVERNEALYAAICPADLAGRKCVWDEVWAWDANERKWRGGCQMIRLCERNQSYPRPPAPALTPYQYALHVPLAAHDTLMALHTGSSAATLSIFRPTHPTSKRHAPHPLLGSVAHTSWPVLIPSPLPPAHEMHIASCTALHGIRRTCYALRSNASNVNNATRKCNKNKNAKGREGTEATCPALLTSGVCLYGHDLPSARQASIRTSERAHAAAAEALVRAGKAVRTQRLQSGRTEVWVYVSGMIGPAGEEGRFVIDGESDVRGAWELGHTVPWCKACNPAPLEVVLGAEQQEQQSGVASGRAEAVGNAQLAYYGYPQVDLQGQHEPLHQHQTPAASEHEHEHEYEEGTASMSWADSESTWQDQDGEELDEGLLKKWREAMSKNSK